MTENVKLIQEVREKIELAEKANSFFIAITRKEGKTLFHYQCKSNFSDDDAQKSLNEIMQLVKGAGQKRSTSPINTTRRFK